MTEVTEENSIGDASPRRSKIQIPVKTGQGEERVVEAAPGSSVMVILDIVAAERGCRVEELILIRDGDDEPLTSALLIEEDYPNKRRHHVHRAGEVNVTIYYQAGQHAHPFKRSATVEDVLIWAITAFNIDPSMASEFELTRHGQKEELPGTEHIGHLAKGDCTLALDLGRGNIANGSAS